jgi:hypothetical protein
MGTSFLLWFDGALPGGSIDFFFLNLYSFCDSVGLCLSQGMRLGRTRTTVTPIKIREMGLCKKMRKLPSDMSSDRRKASSINGLNTKARTKGAASYSNFFNR